MRRNLTVLQYGVIRISSRTAKGMVDSCITVERGKLLAPFCHPIYSTVFWQAFSNLNSQVENVWTNPNVPILCTVSGVMNSHKEAGTKKPNPSPGTIKETVQQNCTAVLYVQ